MGTLAIYVESYIFPFVFLYSIYEHSLFLWKNSEKYPQIIHNILAGAIDIHTLIFVSAILAKFFLILLNSLIVFGFLIRRNLHKKPEGFLEILIPLLGSFFYLLYNFIQYIPERWNPPIMPEGFLFVSTLIGLILNVAGAVISSIATYYLRHSYSLFVEVRDIITHGLYRYVRHPIYLGYIISTLGFCFILPRLSYVIIFLTSIVVTLFRASLEERKLLANSSDYQLYAQKTHFILPLRKRG